MNDDNRFVGLGVKALSEAERECVMKLALKVMANEVADGPVMTGEAATARYLNTRLILQEALRHNADALVCYHNHPSGTAEPSPSDMSLTSRTKDLLYEIDVRARDRDPSPAGPIPGSKGSPRFLGSACGTGHRRLLAASEQLESQVFRQRIVGFAPQQAPTLNDPVAAQPLDIAGFDRLDQLQYINSKAADSIHSTSFRKPLTPLAFFPPTVPWRAVRRSCRTIRSG